VANVICCPQLEASLAILIGQSSKETSVLALNGPLPNLVSQILSRFWQVRVQICLKDLVRLNMLMSL
jgi:hypothetical protein